VYTFALLVAVDWGSAALWFDGPAARWLAGEHPFEENFWGQTLKLHSTILH
jgi:hypothetical protein